jgi:hypothetical protein
MKKLALSLIMAVVFAGSSVYAGVQDNTTKQSTCCKKEKACCKEKKACCKK